MSTVPRYAQRRGSALCVGQRAKPERHQGGTTIAHHVEVAHPGRLDEEVPELGRQSFDTQQGKGDDTVGVVVVDGGDVDPVGDRVRALQGAKHDPGRDVVPQLLGSRGAGPVRQRAHRPGARRTVHHDVIPASEEPRRHEPQRRSTCAAVLRHAAPKGRRSVLPGRDPCA